MKKIYVKESAKKDSDGEALQVVEVSESKMKGLSYLVFLTK